LITACNERISKHPIIPQLPTIPLRIKVYVVQFHVVFLTFLLLDKLRKYLYNTLSKHL